MNQLGVFAAQEENDASDIARLWPFREIGVRYGFAVRFGIDDARENRVRADACAL